MNKTFTENLNENIKVMSDLINIQDQIFMLFNSIKDVINKDGKILICGNGGSAADAQHFAAELVVKFEKVRRPIAAIALTTDTSILTATGNDFSFDKIFSRQVEALAKKNDLMIGITTSGKSKNIINAMEVANKMHVRTVIMTGKSSFKNNFINHSINIPSSKTSRIQEGHLFIYHIICSLLDAEFK